MKNFRMYSVAACVGVAITCGFFIHDWISSSLWFLAGLANGILFFGEPSDE